MSSEPQSVEYKAFYDQYPNAPKVPQTEYVSVYNCTYGDSIQFQDCRLTVERTRHGFVRLLYSYKQPLEYRHIEYDRTGSMYFNTPTGGVLVAISYHPAGSDINSDQTVFLNIQGNAGPTPVLHAEWKHDKPLVPLLEDSEAEYGLPEVCCDCNDTCFMDATRVSWPQPYTRVSINWKEGDATAGTSVGLSNPDLCSCLRMFITWGLCGCGIPVCSLCYYNCTHKAVPVQVSDQPFSLIVATDRLSCPGSTPVAPPTQSMR